MENQLILILVQVCLIGIFGVETKPPNIVFIVADDLGRCNFIILYHNIVLIHVSQRTQAV